MTTLLPDTSKVKTLSAEPLSRMINLLLLFVDKKTDINIARLIF